MPKKTDLENIKEENLDEPKKENHTTEEHFKLFKLECKKWIKEFGLIGWDVSFKHDGEENDRNWLGWCSTNCVGRSATIGLCKDWGKTESDNYEIKRTAFHEVCELLMSRFDTIARTRIIGPDEIDEERHNIIRTMENVIWDKEQTNER